ncbi:hypothetical protein AB0I22_35715 [Streptomyces sp. NPDC050610]|uniref:hypothetical protein n=1 Tax=Streptomyces sp. NPDC050610 TaxID=3157097 RepID=UPI0034402313
MTETPDVLGDLRDRIAGHINAAFDCLSGITDPVERERAARVLGDDLMPDAIKRVKEVRGASVRELRDRGLKLREVAELLGITAARVDQLAKGK